ncbi:MAG: hypothetical protein R2690_04335 [Acidimicrobiales bacterium]
MLASTVIYAGRRRARARCWSLVTLNDTVLVVFDERLPDGGPPWPPPSPC